MCMPRLDKRFKMSVQRDSLLDSTGLQNAIFLADRLAHLLDLPRNFFTLAHICHVRLWLSISNDWSRYAIANSLNPFLYRPFVSALFLSIVTNRYFCCQIAAQNSSRNVGIYMIVVNVSSWYRPVWTESRIALSRISLSTSSRTFDRDRSSRRSRWPIEKYSLIASYLSHATSKIKIGFECATLSDCRLLENVK